MPPAASCFPFMRVRRRADSKRDVRMAKTGRRCLCRFSRRTIPKEFLVAHRLWPIRRAASRDSFFHQQRQLTASSPPLHLSGNVDPAISDGPQAQRPSHRQAPPLEATAKIDARITRLFPFELTAAQKQAIGEIAADMARPVPMNRLLQGDVGCGKTVVAVYAMLLAVAHGSQAALMAPTEVLARQHRRTLEKLLAGSRVRIALLSGSLSAKERQETLAKLATGEIDLLIGTQAIVYGEAQFEQLGLVVIDERRRFGVRRRRPHAQAGWRRRSALPRHDRHSHPAAPIALTLYGDLDVSTIAESPPGRQGVHTYMAKDDTRRMVSPPTTRKKAARDTSSSRSSKSRSTSKPRISKPP